MDNGSFINHYTDHLIKFMRTIGSEADLASSAHDVMQIVSGTTLVQLLEASTEDVRESIKAAATAEGADVHSVIQIFHHHFPQDQINIKLAANFQDYLRQIFDQVKDRLDPQQITEVEQIFKEIAAVPLTSSEPQKNDEGNPVI